MTRTENFIQVEVKSAEELHRWLLEHHDSHDSIWLVTFKKVVPEYYLSTSEVLDELISFGWTDGVRRKLDEQRTMQLISPRKAEHWAKTYKDRATRLIEEGRMMPSGYACIKRAKENGLWSFMDDVDALIKPPDLIKALESREPAMDFFSSFAPSHQRNVLRWIKLARTEATRQKRIRKVADLAQQGDKIPGM